MATILVVDDEEVLCDLIQQELSYYGHEVLIATGGRKGIELFTQHRPHLTLLDLRMPPQRGLAEGFSRFPGKGFARDKHISTLALPVQHIVVDSRPVFLMCGCEDDPRLFLILTRQRDLVDH